jgi:hypothetical protein
MLAWPEYAVASPLSVRQIEITELSPDQRELTRRILRFNTEQQMTINDAALTEISTVEYRSNSVRVETVTNMHGRADTHEIDGIRYNAAGAAKQVLHFREDRLEHVNFLSADGLSVGAIYVDYDAKGRRQRVSLQLPVLDNDVRRAGLSKVTFATSYKYSDDPRCEELTLSAHGASMGRHVIEYASDGLPSRRVHLRPDGGVQSEVSYRYVKNDRGDWIERTTVSDGRTLSIIRRTIDYAE